MEIKEHLYSELIKMIKQKEKEKEDSFYLPLELELPLPGYYEPEVNVRPPEDQENSERGVIVIDI